MMRHCCWAAFRLRLTSCRTLAGTHGQASELQWLCRLTGCRGRPTCEAMLSHRNDVKTLWLQEQGLDTVDANRALGLPDDCREYTSVRNILRDLGVKSIKLMVRVAVQCRRCSWAAAG